MLIFEYERDDMKFPGYWVSAFAGGVTLEMTTFDETELDPATNWKQAWQNEDAGSQTKGYVELDEALVSAASVLAKNAERSLNRSDLDGVIRYQPVWQDGRCEIKSIFQLIDPGTV